MKTPLLRGVAAAVGLACGAAHAASYVKLAGEHIDFYYDSDFWTLGAAVSGTTISLRPGGMAASAQVTEGAADPNDGPLFTAGVAVDRAFDQAVIAVAHAGYTLNNQLNAVGAYTLRYTGYYGDSTQSLISDFTSGTFGSGGFSAGAALGRQIQWSYRYTHEFTWDGAASYEPLELATSLNAHAAIAASGVFSASASTSGLGLAEAGLDSVSYTFDVSAVPEPEQYALLGAGLALLAFVACKRRQENRG